MDLLSQIARSPYDPDYVVVAARDPAPHGRRWLVAVVAVLVGGMFALAAVQTSRRAPALVGERADLLARVQAAEADSDALRARAGALAAEIGSLRTAVTGTNSSVQGQQSAIEALEPASGAVAVRGPGLVIVVDDSREGTDQRANRVHDVDLQILANGLWQAGAEAIAINGHRLSALTAIRGAGEAITVDFRSLARPYRVEAIGDARTLEARFAESTGGVWWNQLAQNQRFGYETQIVGELTLPADTGLRLRHAQAVR
jgi:uncharacterized protein YlxW (UPF0749 family)